MERKLYLILDNIRSAHNVGSILRTCDGLNIVRVYLCGVTPYPQLKNDTRLAHLANKIHRRIAKTALGAELTQSIKFVSKTSAAIYELQKQDVEVVALEQTKNALALTDYRPSGPVALVIGNEVDGISQATLTLCSKTVQIPMLGQKESFNVSAAASMALFYLRFMV